MNKQLKLFLTILLFGLILLVSHQTVLANETTEVKATIIPGELTLITPKIEKFKVKIKVGAGVKEYSVGDLQVSVTDIRGPKTNWQLLAKSSNYSQYQEFYTLRIKDKMITNESINIISKTEIKNVTDFTLPIALEIEPTVKAGTYHSFVEWTLLPVEGLKIQQ